MRSLLSRPLYGRVELHSPEPREKRRSCKSMKIHRIGIPSVLFLEVTTALEGACYVTVALHSMKLDNSV